MTTYTEEADKVTAELGDGSKITAEQMVMATNVPEQKVCQCIREGMALSRNTAHHD
jgi:hypothetical protein